MPLDTANLSPEIVEHINSELAPLKAKRDELLARNSELSALAKELESLGGLETIKSLKAAADKAAADAEEARLNAMKKDNKTAELEQHYNGLLSQRDEKMTKLQQKLINREVEAALQSAIAEEEGSALLLMPHLKNRIEAVMDDEGQISIVVKGAAGQTTDESGKPLSVKSLVAETKKNPEFAMAFKANPASGGGNRPNTGKGNAGNPFAEATRNVTKQMELIKANPDLARTLAKEAGISPAW